jgi:Ricin-type beta-trefoil lectin domain
MCLDYNGLGNFSGIDVNPCNASQNQKWYFDLGIARQEVPTANPKFLLKRIGTNQCLNVNSPYDNKYIGTWDCNSADQDQLWEAINSNGGGLNFRRLYTNQCVDAFNPYNNRVVYSWTCDNNASNHAWYYSSNTHLIQQRNTNQCLAKWNPSNGSAINTWECNSNDGNLWWEAIQVY